MNKLFRTKFIAEAIDVEHFWVNCPIPSYMCCERSHKYKSNGIWNGNHKRFVKSKCICNYGELIEVNITPITERATLLIDNKGKIYDKKLFKKSLKKYRENQDLGKTQNYI